jgi:undecaprenyl-diphosphatase
VRAKRHWLKYLGASITGLLLTVSSKVLATNVSLPTTPTPQINLVQALVLGIVQGLTEFLPISSTGHLKFVSVIMGWGNPSLAFTASLELGSIAAVVWYFWKDIIQITVGAFKAIQTADYQSQNLQLLAGIALGTVPIAFCGLIIKLFVPGFENSPLRTLGAIAIASILMSVLLGLAENFGKRQRNFATLGLLDGVLMGLAQAMAIIPGISRSGSTLTAGLFMGLERAAAARFSFLLAIPAIILTGLVELKDALEEGLGGDQLIPLMVGIFSAAIVSYAAIGWLLHYLQNRSTWIFVWYRLAFGVLLLAALITGIVKNI